MLRKCWAGEEIAQLAAETLPTDTADTGQFSSLISFPQIPLHHTM